MVITNEVQQNVRESVKAGNWSRKILTHWGRVTHRCVSKLNIMGSNNGLSPGRRQAIIWTIAGKLLIGPLGTNINKNSIEIYALSFTKIHWKLSSGKWRPFCLGLNVLTNEGRCHICSIFIHWLRPYLVRWRGKQGAQNWLQSGKSLWGEYQWFSTKQFKTAVTLEN